jgi:hypothetical protein
MEDGFCVEVRTIGSEGMVGQPAILGDTCVPSTVTSRFQVALKMDARLFREEFARSSTLKVVALRYVHAFLIKWRDRRPARIITISNNVAAFLITCDRMPSYEFLLTHEFLGTPCRA